MAETHNITFPITEIARRNTEFRNVILTGDHTQVVLMAIPQGQEIGGETHDGHDQVLVFVQGEGKAVIGETEKTVQAGDLAFVPAGTYHNFVSTGPDALKLWTTYSPPEHAPGTEQTTKADADAA